MNPKTVDEICRRYLPMFIPAGSGSHFGPNTAVITAATPDYLPGLQVLISSIRRIHHWLPICVFDLGLTHAQRYWLDRASVDIVEMPHRMVGNHINGWATYNKPFYLLNNRFSRCLWIDADCIVTRPLDALFASLSKDVPLIIRHAAVTDETRNKDGFYELAPSIQSRLPPHQLPNNGVIGFDKENPAHLHILRHWAMVVATAALSPEMQATIAWYDEGALQAALEILGFGDAVIEAWDWNHFAYSKHTDPVAFFESLESSRTIHHFTGPSKYWQLWDVE